MKRVFFDTETTGFGSSARLLEIGWVILDGNNNIQQRASYLISGQTEETPEKALAVHGITMKMCNEFGITLGDAMARFYKSIVGCDDIVAHNVSFDKGVIKNNFIKCGLLDQAKTWDETNDMTCTMKMAKATKRFEAHNLQHLYDCLYPNKEVVQDHRVMGDIMMTIDVWKKIM